MVTPMPILTYGVHGDSGSAWKASNCAVAPAQCQIGGDKPTWTKPKRQTLTRAHPAAF